MTSSPMMIIIPNGTNCLFILTNSSYDYPKDELLDLIHGIEDIPDGNQIIPHV